MRYLTLLAFGVLAASSQATVLFSAGFESGEGYVLGGIAGQQGWDAASDADMSVVNTMASSGTNSLLINTDSATWASGSGWSWPNLVPVYDPAATSEKILVTGADFFVQSGVNEGTSLRRFGFDAYTPGVARIAMARMRSDNGQIELLSGLGGSATSVGSWSRDAWHRLELILNYNNNTARVNVDGVDAGISVAIDGTTTVNDVDVQANEGAGSSQGVAFVDNYRVEAVPEPATIAALGLGAAAMLRRRRK